jgi:hypothetical protein
MSVSAESAIGLLERPIEAHPPIAETDSSQGHLAILLGHLMVESPVAGNDQEKEEPSAEPKEEEPRKPVLPTRVPQDPARERIPSPSTE